MSQSKTLREESNAIFKTINACLAPSIRESRLLNCLKLYQQAISCSIENDELASCYKNHGVVAFDLYTHYADKNNTKWNLLAFYFEECIQNYEQALKYGEQCKSLDWLDNIKEKATCAVDDYCSLLLRYASDEEQQIAFLIKLKNKSIDIINCQILYNIALYYYKSSLINNDVNLRKSFRAISESNYFYEECFKLKNKINFDFKFDLNDFNANRIMQECAVVGLKHKNQADLLLDELINYDEAIEFEKVWDCVDLYHEAIVKTKDKDLELEAEILSILGHIYTSILKLKEKAKTCYYASIRLAESMRPKLFTTKSWYIRCTNAIKSYQKEVTEEEELEKQKQRDKVKAEIEDDIEIIEEAAKKDSRSFINFIYEKYPPKNTKQKCACVVNNDTSKDDLKNAFKKAATHYHPDKNLGKDYGFAWFFIIEEVCLLLYIH